MYAAEGYGRGKRNVRVDLDSERDRTFIDIINLYWETDGEAISGFRKVPLQVLRLEVRLGELHGWQILGKSLAQQNRFPPGLRIVSHSRAWPGLKDAGCCLDTLTAHCR